MLVRRATPEDLPAIRALEQQTETAAHWAEREYDALFSPDAPPRLVLVAASENETGEIHGFLIARCAVAEWEIENVAVAHDARRCGAGSAMMRELFSKAESAGATSVLLEVRESNTTARLFYERLGFRVKGRRSNYYQNPVEDALLLCLSIAVV